MIAPPHSRAARLYHYVLSMGTPGRKWKEEFESAQHREDLGRIRELAGEGVGRAVRYLTGHLYADNAQEKWRAVRALGGLVADTALVDERRAKDLLQRFVWALNDESGAVPYGIPEAMGELLANRPEFQESFLPILCGLLTESELSQTGEIERGAIWAVGRVGPPVAGCSPEAVAAVRRAAQSHPNPSTRETAADSLKRITGEGEQ